MLDQQGKPSLEHISCNFCGSENFKSVSSSRDFQIVKCRQCGLQFTNPRLTSQGIQALYEDSSYLSERNPASWSTHHSKFFHNQLARMECLVKGRKILEVGCGGGYFLNCAINRGWDVYGQDISNFAAKHIQSEYGIDIFVGYLEDACFDTSTFDVVFMSHVLEHVMDAQKTIEECWRILKPDGLLVIVVPNVASPDLLLIPGLKEVVLHLPYHNYHFTQHTLKKYLKKNNFDPLYIETGYSDFLKNIKKNCVGLFHHSDSLQKYEINENELLKIQYNARPRWKVMLIDKFLGNLFPNYQLLAYGRKYI